MEVRYDLGVDINIRIQMFRKERKSSSRAIESFQPISLSQSVELPARLRPLISNVYVLIQ